MTDRIGVGSGGSAAAGAESAPERLPLGLALNLWERMGSWDQAVEIARAADELGYDCVVLPESFGRDGFVLCDRLLAATRNIRVCLGIANVFSRSPALLAASAATLDESSGGRFVLGLGASTRNLVEGWHGLAFERPMARMRETLEICRRIWRRDPSPYEGAIFRPSGVKLAFEPVRERIPIWMGSLLPRSVELCGTHADGWMPTLLPLDAVGPGREVLSKAAAAAGRPADAVEVCPSIQVLAGDDPAPLLGMLRFAVAIYYGPPGSPYARAAAALGYAEDVEAVARAYAEGGSPAAAGATSERLARSVGILGTLDSCREQLDALLGQGADKVILGMPGPTRALCEPILEGLIPERLRA